MTIVADAPADPLTEWLLHVRPVGLVIGPNILREEELVPPRQSAVDTEAVRIILSEDVDAILPDPWAFFSSVLGWEARFVAGATGGPELPESLTVKVPEHDLTLTPDWAVRELGAAGSYQLLVKLHLVADADQRGALVGWEASPHQQFERLLREGGVPTGVLIDRTHLRVVYARSGETSGWISFPLRSLATVAGRPMLGGLKLMLGHARLFTEPQHRRLAKLLERSREAQNQVSTKLAEQVLGALHELLRALHAADPARIEQLAATRPQHLYEGLLATLLRLVFLLYAEDRDLIPTVRSGEPMEIYEEGYSVRGLYARLVEDRALHPDTMDERVGGWGRLLALFRLVHGGHSSGWITPRGGKLFDPEAFPFLEGRDNGEPLSVAKVLPIRDGAILRILEGLMTIEARTLSGERVRERVSYRALDVEQIGSVYETVMGFKAMPAEGHSLAIRAGKNNRTPVFVDLDKLAAAKGKDRIKYLKEEADRGQLSAGVAKAIEAAKTAAELAAALDPIVDERGSPKKHAIADGTPILQPTDERRRTGSHYTPRSLTEPIVRHALEPAFERLGPDATPEQILDLKVCDPAMGSGAFLVEACRALAARLVKAWERHPDKKPKDIPPDEQENGGEIYAKRLIAQRSLYGVDKNPLATDLAKLSLWLATLARDHEFTFLDHALKSGDSLVGLTQAQIAAVHWIRHFSEGNTSAQCWIRITRTIY
jgi:N-6 DNA Methylase